MESVQAANSLSSLLPCGRVVMQMRESQSSLPGLTPQVGFTRLAAHYTAQLGQARVAVQSILFAKKFLRRGWTRGSGPRVTEGLCGASRVRGRREQQSQSSLPGLT